MNLQDLFVLVYFNSTLLRINISLFLMGLFKLIKLFSLFGKSQLKLFLIKFHQIKQNYLDGFQTI
jgi:hypothetical protein